MSTGLIIDLLRHGACSDGKIYRGRTDSPLSSRGWTQMRAVMASSHSSGWQSVYSSPLQRCLLPARQLTERLGVSLHEEPRLRELDFGAWDGQLQQRVWQQQQSQVLAFWQDPIAHPPPGSESIRSLQQRVAAQLLQWLMDKELMDKELMDQGSEDGAGPPKDSRLLCITHGGVIRTLLCQLLGMSITAAQSLSIDYGSMTRIALYPEPQPDDKARPFHAQVVFINRLPELGGYEAGYEAEETL
ncbi:MAG: alpha-ribazole phosphatase [Motiliproteus sp.]